MLPQGSNKKQKTAADADADADAHNLAALPPDVLANVLLWLPASDLHRFRRVCKKWRLIISDQSFIDAHIVHRPRAPTHTIVFYPGCSQADGALNGGGFLFNEQWKLTARFTVDKFAEMIGTCKSLLFFRDSVHGLIRVVEPFTGESIVLPLPPTAEAETCSTASYCFGFDAKARRYKIVYSVFEEKAIYEGYFLGPRVRSTQELQVFTVGADKTWRTVRVRGARRHGVLYGNPACDDGAVHWYSQGYFDGFSRNVRFDLATEEITSERCRLGTSEITCRYLPLLCPEHTIGIRWFGELDSGGGCWSKHIDTVTHETFDVTPRGVCCLSGPHAVQRGHLLLRWHKDGALRAHPIEGSGVSTLDIRHHWYSKTLIEIGSMKEEHAERYRFFPVHRRHCQDLIEDEVPVIGRLPSKQLAISTFAYVPTLSPAPFAPYLGTSLKDLQNL